MGWLDAQGYGGAGARFAETATALSRRRELDGATAVATGKTEEEEKRRRRRLGSNNTAQKLKEAALWPSPRQRDAQTATHATGSQLKLAGNVASAVDTVHSNYRNAIRQNSQITLKFL